MESTSMRAKLASTDAPSAVTGMAAGALAGGLLVTGTSAVGMALSGGWLWTPPWLILLMLAAASGVWGLGIALLGAPIWWLLHRGGIRSPVAAVALGVSLTFFVGVFIGTGGFGLSYGGPGTVSMSDGGGATVVTNQITLHGWLSAVRMAGLLAIGGGIVGYVVRRVAYGSPPPR